MPARGASVSAPYRAIPVEISCHSWSTSQCRWPCTETGPFGKRCSSRSVKRSPSHCPSITRPLDAPKSIARKLVVWLIPSLTPDSYSHQRGRHIEGPHHLAQLVQGQAFRLAAV